MISIVTCVAPVNIAVIKYWGKRDEKLILPLNDSVSGTLSLDHMRAKTTIAASPHFKQDKIWLNGKEESFDNTRLQNCLQEIRRRSNQNDEIIQWHIHICSENNFPTAAGLASSAAGYACLVYALSQLYNVGGDISTVARQGSGSACRSVFGGFVRWHRGTAADGSDSIATQIVPAEHWPQMRVLILVVNDQQKKTSSTSGMQRSVANSELLQHRVDACVQPRTEKMKQAIIERDFSTFAELTMKDSNQFHAVCLDTYPPAVYMNDISHTIAGLVHAYNSLFDAPKVAYTFDAGPNACLYLLESDVDQVAAVIRHFLPPPTDVAAVEYMRGIPIADAVLEESVLSGLAVPRQPPGQLKYLLHTCVGGGPSVVSDARQHLLDERGLPKKLAAQAEPHVPS